MPARQNHCRLYLGLAVAGSIGCGDGAGPTEDIGTLQQRLAPIVYLSFENSSWRPDTATGKWLYDPWNDHTFHLPVEGEPGTYHAWVSSTISNEGRKSLGVRLYDVVLCGDVKQRVEFSLSNAEYYTQHLEELRYYGIALYIHPQSQNVITKKTIFLQAWQIHDVSSNEKFHPPFSLSFVANSNYRWSVNVAGVEPDNLSVIYTSPTGLAKGVWHEFIVLFKPSITSSGAVKVWHNGEYKVGQTHQRNFGYRPRSTYPIIKDEFAVRFGAYRGRLCTDPPTSLGETILMFDQVKYGTSYSSVDP